MKRAILTIGIIVVLLVMIGWFYHNKNIDKNVDESGKNNMNLITSIHVVIDDKKYVARIDTNETAQTFVNKLPQSFDMSELNGNEKYIYMDFSLPTNSSNPKHIVAGDIMLYGDDCLVIFYKSFDTNYRYTKIGHIDNLEELGNGSITATFEK